MHRRRFLALSAASGIALGAGRAGFAASSGPAAAAVVVTDIGPATDPAGLFAVLDGFTGNGLWITCALSAPETATPETYRTLVQGLRARAPAVEIALDLPELGRLSPHFQGRAAFEARRRLASLSDTGDPLDVRSVLCHSAAPATDPVGVRSAGVRTVLVRPDTPGPTRSEAWANGVARFFGGTPLAPLSAVLPRGTPGTLRLYYVSADSFAGLTEADLRRWAADLAAAFLDAEVRGEMSAMPVSELQLRDDFGFTRQVALRLVGDDPALAALAEPLARFGIPVLAEPDPAVQGYWVPEPSAAEAPNDVIALRDITCDPSGRLSVADDVALPPGIAVVPVAGPEGEPGLDGCAALELRELRLDTAAHLDTPLIPPGAQDDLILSIHPAALVGPGAERALLAGLEALEQDGITRFVALDRLVNDVLSHDPIEERFRRTQAVALSPEPAPGALSPEAVAGYMDDARLAWAFFDRFTDPGTGLAPATADVNTGGDALNWVTMWDVGSQINALIAAHRLGLVETAPFEAAADKILYQIAGAQSQGRLLPNGVIRTDVLRSGSSDFDGCDAGRLLASLDNLRRNSTRGDAAAALVSSWGLDQIVQDGAIWSVTDGALKSTYKSHCAHYAARAFERWGFEAGSPYRTLDGRSEADGRMAMLETVAGIGPLGAEPLLLEALELGASPESAWLAEVLHVAQTEEYAETGTLMAVSEMPIQRDPWFVYLGLQLGRETREWAIDVVGGGAAFQSQAFLEQNMALSTKAAYLWAAERPGPYADALVAWVRDRARLSVGFASNVSPDPDGEVAPFTDLNTNAIILQAIARIVLGDDSGAAPHP